MKNLILQTQKLTIVCITQMNNCTKTKSKMQNLSDLTSGKISYMNIKKAILLIKVIKHKTNDEAIQIVEDIILKIPLGVQTPIVFRAKIDVYLDSQEVEQDNLF